MAAKLALSSSSSSLSSSSSKVSVLLSSWSYNNPFTHCNSFSSLQPKFHGHFRVHANLGGDGGVKKPKSKRKFVTREEEPDQFWQTAGEREGENPMKTPIPYIIIFGMSTPFIILAVAFANGWIKVPVR